MWMEAGGYQMKRIEPFIKCVDFWPVHIPEEKLAAYKSMIDEGQIRKHHVIYNRQTGATIVEYYAIAPHDWILEELRRKCSR